MHKGEKKRALTSGIERLGIARPPRLRMEVEDSRVAEVEGIGWTAYLVAKEAGITRLRYSPRSEGFLVRVLDGENEQ